jgi:hypothetical protein
MDQQKSLDLIPVIASAVAIIGLILSYVRSVRTDERVRAKVSEEIKGEIRTGNDALGREFRADIATLRNGMADLTANDNKLAETLRREYREDQDRLSEGINKLTTGLAVLEQRIGSLENAFQELTIRSLRQVHQDEPATRRDARLDDLIDRYTRAEHMEDKEVRELIQLLQAVEKDPTVSALRRDQAGRSLVGLRLKYPL